MYLLARQGPKLIFLNTFRQYVKKQDKQYERRERLAASPKINWFRSNMTRFVHNVCLFLRLRFSCILYYIHDVVSQKAYSLIASFPTHSGSFATKLDYLLFFWWKSPVKNKIFHFSLFRLFIGLVLDLESLPFHWEFMVRIYRMNVSFLSNKFAN